MPIGDDGAMGGELWAITGATGYLGRTLRAELDALGVASRGLGYQAGGADLTGDVRDRATVEALVRGATVVVHLAAFVHRSGRGRVAQECWSVNVDGTQTLLDAVTAVAAEAFVIFVSSASVYGPGNAACDEEAPLQPETPYGRSKAEAERRLLLAISQRQLRGCILRPAMIFGSGAPGNLEKLRRMVRRGWAVEIAGGTQRKSIVPVSHVIAAIRAVAENRDACDGEVFNVAGETRTIHEIITALGGEDPLRIVSVPKWMIAPAAPFFPAVRTYMSDAVISGEKLARVADFNAPETAATALSRLSDGRVPQS